MSSSTSNTNPTAGAIKRLIATSTLKTKLTFAIVIVGVIAICIAGFSIASKTAPKAISASSLTNAVNISKLATAEVSYEGIADKLDDNGNPVYHVFYKSTVTASVDMSAIEFDIDRENGIVRPKLPDLVIGDPVIDERSFDYIPDSPGVEIKEVVSICKEDAKRDANQNNLINQTAERNYRQIVEALTKPLLDQAGYTIEWPDDSEKEGSNEAT